MPRELAQAVVHRFDRVGRIDHLADLRREIEEGGQPVPIAAPGLADRRIVGIPLGFELAQAQLGFFERGAGVDALESGRARIV